MSTRFKNITVLGTGVLGSQIIFQTAYSGFDVVAYDVADDAIAKLPARWEQLSGYYTHDLGSTPEQLSAAVGRIRATTDLADAVKDADLVIEAVPESIAIKHDTYTKLSQLAPEKTVFASNSSTLLLSDMVSAVNRPEKFVALHFANNIWRQNIAEVMGHEGTDPEVYEELVRFAEAIGMEPIRVLKEQPGYVLNSLLVPLLNSAAGLLIKGVADYKTIDFTWRKATGAPLGPFMIFDIVGMMTPYHLAMARAENDPGQAAWANYLKENFIDQGKLGRATGEGFYKYDADGNIVG
ncbi:3-hydroxyacyl-CoA dehydrogenase [Gulosibacter bifidus]|uniref:3-hydroxyacyl-CoA dehydrogenase n=1 Tax=Gulosibacter bifidus TaxID=272239 RepID=A0ABW5RK00_9MICO|nr:3-hydroxyacyl-CoA dehydrogenase [Gulosibacter bifidus]